MYTITDRRQAEAVVKVCEAHPGKQYLVKVEDELNLFRVGMDVDKVFKIDIQEHKGGRVSWRHLKQEQTAEALVKRLAGRLPAEGFTPAEEYPSLDGSPAKTTKKSKAK